MASKEPEEASRGVATRRDSQILARGNLSQAERAVIQCNDGPVFLLSIGPSFVAALLQHARSTLVASKSFACFFDRFFERYHRKESSEDPGESLEEAPRELRESLREPLEGPGEAPGGCSAGSGCPGKLRERPGKPREALGDRPGDPRELLRASQKSAGTPRESPGRSLSGRGKALWSALRAPDKRIVRYVET